jgi:hypothetical protein
MLEQIKCTSGLIPYLHKIIEDEGIIVDVDVSLDENNYIGIKIDDYYNGLHDSTTPKAVDFIVIVDCVCNSYALYILEFKNVNSSKHLVIKDIHEKFETTIKDFMVTRYNNIFMNDSYKYKVIKLYLVSDAYGVQGKFQNHQEYRKYLEKVNKRDSLKVDLNLGSKIYRFRNRCLQIEYDIPPNPIIRKVV